MPITVSCPACGSRFSLSDDLYRRRVAGSLVKVKCRHCSAEIAVDATESASMQSPEAPRNHPPPRRKSVTRRGLGVPPATSTLATSSPLPDHRDHDHDHSSLPLNATVTPLPLDETPVRAMPASLASDSLWGDDEETIAINLDKVKPQAKPLGVHTAADSAEDLEQIDAEEIPASDGPISESPVSSSGTPTLDALTVEAGGAHVPHGRAAPDSFLVQFGGGGDGNVGAPTIDVTGFASEVTPTNVAVHSEERELEERRARANTVPLFDMNGVLPTASNETTRSKANDATRSKANDATRSKAVPQRAAAPEVRVDSPSVERPARERKFVVPPETDAALMPVATRKKRRSRAPLWAGLVAAAGIAGAAFGYRERMRDVPTETALPSTVEPVVNTQAALPAEAVNPVAPSEAATVAPAATTAPAATAPATGATQNVTVTTTRNVAPSSAAAVKSTKTSEQSTAKAEPALDKPIETEAHNAPPAAAPDTEFNRDAARNALASAATQASACRKEGDPSGTANLTITFAPSGRVTSAQVQGPPFSGTATGGCIASTMRHASVPAFSGDYVTVSKTIVIQ